MSAFRNMHLEREILSRKRIYKTLLWFVVVPLSIVGVLCIFGPNSTTEGPIQDGWGCPTGPGVVEGTWELYKEDPATKDKLGTLTITADQLVFENPGTMRYVRKRLTRDQIIEHGPRASGTYLEILESDIEKSNRIGSYPFAFYAYPSRSYGRHVEDCVMRLHLCQDINQVAGFLDDENTSHFYCNQIDYKKLEPPTD